MCAGHRFSEGKSILRAAAPSFPCLSSGQGLRLVRLPPALACERGKSSCLPAMTWDFLADEWTAVRMHVR